MHLSFVTVCIYSDVRLHMGSEWIDVCICGVNIHAIYVVRTQNSLRTMVATYYELEASVEDLKAMLKMERERSAVLQKTIDSLRNQLSGKLCYLYCLLVMCTTDSRVFSLYRDLVI